MDDKSALAALGTYFDLMSMNGGVHVYQTARKLGIFDAIGQGASAAEVARKCGLTAKGVELLLAVLRAMRVVECDGDRYSLTPVMRLLTGNYQNLSDEYWAHLPTLLRTGEPLAKMDAADQSESQYEKQVTALAWMMKPSAEAAAMILGFGTSRGTSNILDVGAGAGVWSLTMAQKDHTTTVTALDWPAITKIAAAAAAAAGLGDRFTALPGNFHDVDLPGETYDLAILGNVTHIETPTKIVALLGRIRAALVPGGEIAIFDVMPASEAGALPAALYALGLALRTETGQVHSSTRLQQLLTEADFVDPSMTPLPVVPYTMAMVLARKPESC